MFELMTHDDLQGPVFGPDARAFDPNEINEAGYRILRELEAGRKPIEQILEGLGKRARDPEDFSDQAAGRLVSDIRILVNARSFSMADESKTPEEIKLIYRQLSYLSEITQKPTDSLPLLTPQEIAVVLPHVRRRMRFELNRKRAAKGRMPI